MMNTVGIIVSIVVVIIMAVLFFLLRGKTPEDNLNKKLEAARNAANVSSVRKIDDLTRVEGIGPKIQSLLESKGINTYGDLARADVEKLRKIMLDNNLRIADPTTWPKQSQLLVEGKLDELKKYQDSLKGGRMV
jgi:small subunit ribosomal protein S2